MHVYMRAHSLSLLFKNNKTSSSVKTFNSSSVKTFMFPKFSCKTIFILKGWKSLVLIVSYVNAKRSIMIPFKSCVPHFLLCSILFIHFKIYSCRAVVSITAKIHFSKKLNCTLVYRIDINVNF